MSSRAAQSIKPTRGIQMSQTEQHKIKQRKKERGRRERERVANARNRCGPSSGGTEWPAAVTRAL